MSDTQVPVEDTQVEATEVEATEPEGTEPEDTDAEVSDESDDDAEVELDALEIDKSLQERCSTGQDALQDIGDLIALANDRKVWEDERVTRDDGKGFDSLGAYLRYRLKGYPLVDKALTKTVITLLLESGVSTRAVAEITGKSKSTVSNINGERKGRKPRNQGGSTKVEGGESPESTDSESGDEPRKDVDGQGSTPAEESTKLASMVVNALTVVGNRVDELEVKDIDRILAAMDENRGIFEAMREIKLQNEAVDGVDAA